MPWFARALVLATSLLISACAPEVLAVERDDCPFDLDKLAPGQCGCGVADLDADLDQVPDCFDACALDPDKTGPGVCGCGVSDDDLDADGVVDCLDNCPAAANGDQADRDGDEVGDACDNCLRVPNLDQADADADGVGDLCWCDPRPAACVDGWAGGFPCSGVDLYAHVTLEEMEFEHAHATPDHDHGELARGGSDIWGWTDAASGREFAIMGIDQGTVYYEVTNPWCPEFEGFLYTPTTASGWHDIRTFDDHALVVSEAGGHGMQVLDLRPLLDVTDGPVDLHADARYEGFGNAHNISVNEDTGRAYVVGTGTCSGGLHVLDVDDPLQPVLEGCYGGQGYVHDAQCVIYAGPDKAYEGREICVTSNGWSGTIGIVDMTDPSAPVELARPTYPGHRYTHQGWLSEDHSLFFLGDEVDEVDDHHPTRTYVWDLFELDNPRLVGSWESTSTATDHNMFVRDGLLFQANYRAGLRILDTAGAIEGKLAEVGFFDVVPESDEAGYAGAWGVYPFLPSGTVLVSSIEGGLFVLRPTGP